MTTSIIHGRNSFLLHREKLLYIPIFSWLYFLATGSLLSEPVVTQGTSLFQNTGET